MLMKQMEMRRRTRCCLAAAVACGVVTARDGYAAAPPQAPNVVVINIDDMGYADLAPYNTDNIQADTPTATRLANEGLRFTNYYVNSPICSASRAALLTGQYPTRWGINSFIDNRANNRLRDTRDFLSLDAPVIARTLQQQAGYESANVGKWQRGGGRVVRRPSHRSVPAAMEHQFLHRQPRQQPPARHARLPQPRRAGHRAHAPAAGRVRDGERREVAPRRRARRRVRPRAGRHRVRLRPVAHAVRRPRRSRALPEPRRHRPRRFVAGEQEPRHAQRAGHALRDPARHELAVLRRPRDPVRAADEGSEPE